MKKSLKILIPVVLAVFLAACGQNKANNTAGNNISGLIHETVSEDQTNDAAQKNNDTTEISETTGMTPIILTIGDKILEGYLNDSAPAKSLIEQLPLTVSLNDSNNDFCGGNLDIDYSENDITTGYKNGEIAFWTPANNFVIFVSGEENSVDTGNLVKLGAVTSPQEMLDELEGKIEVMIALKTENIKVKITVDDTEIYAELENNATSKALIEKMPMTLPMQDLYGREMCYRYGANALPTENLRQDGYEVGDIAYWPPKGSLVILYKQNGEQFERQHLGHIGQGVEIFETSGDAEVTFEVVSD